MASACWELLEAEDWQPPGWAHAQLHFLLPHFCVASQACRLQLRLKAGFDDFTYRPTSLPVSVSWMSFPEAYVKRRVFRGKILGWKFLFWGLERWQMQKSTCVSMKTWIWNPEPESKRSRMVVCTCYPKTGRVETARFLGLCCPVSLV